MPNSKHGIQSQIPTFRSNFVALMKNHVFDGAAPWVQTIVLILTLIYMQGQIREMAKQNRIAQGSKLYDLMHDYQHLAPQLNEVRRLGWRSRDTSVRTDVFLRELSGVDPKAVLRDYLRHESELESCARFGACDPKTVNAFLCKDSRQTYRALFYSPYTVQPGWERLRLYRFELPLMGYIDRYCGFWDQFGLSE